MSHASNSIVSTIVIDNTNVSSLDVFIDRAYQLLIMIMNVTGLNLKLRMVTVYPRIRVTLYDPNESLLSFFKKIPRIENSPCPSDDTINKAIDQIGKGNDIVLLLDRHCIFKKEYIDETVQKNGLVVSLYKRMKYDRDIHFYEAHGIKVVRIQGNGRINDYTDVISVLTSDSIISKTKSYESVVMTRSYIEKLFFDTEIDSNPIAENPDRIDTIFVKYIEDLYRIEALLASIDSGYIWTGTDVAIFKYPELPNADAETDAKTDAETDVETETENNIDKQMKITMKQVMDYCFKYLSSLNQTIVQTYLDLDSKTDNSDRIRDLDIHTNYCRYRSSTILSKLEAHTKDSQYIAPIYDLPYSDSESDSNSDSDSDSDSDSELNINITQISKTWKRYSSHCTARLTKMMDLNISSKLKDKLSQIVKERNEQIDKTEDEYDAKVKEMRTFYTSTLTLRPWIEVLRSGNSIGMNMDIDVGFYMKARYNIYLGSLPKLMGTTSEFFDGIRSRGFTDIQTNAHCLDGVFGDSNVILPLFITNLNWKIAKHYVDPICNMIVNNSHMIVDPGAWRIYYIMLVDFFSCIITNRPTDRDTIRRYFSFWFTAYNLTRDRKVMNIEGYVKKAIQNDYDICAGMIGGQALTLINKASPIKENIIDHCIRMIVRSHTLMDHNYDKCINGETVSDLNYPQMFRLMSFEICIEIFEKFFEEVLSEKELIKIMVQNYSIVPDDTIDSYIRIMNESLNVSDREDREKKLIQRIDRIIDEEYDLQKKNKPISSTVPLEKTEHNSSLNRDVMSMLVQF
jgi:hypothetical protein